MGRHYRETDSTESVSDPVRNESRGRPSAHGGSIAWPAPSSIQGGPNPKDQEEEREARIAEIQERIRRHQEQADSHQEQADRLQREADRLIESVKRRQAGELPSSFVERRKKPTP